MRLHWTESYFNLVVGTPSPAEDYSDAREHRVACVVTPSTWELGVSGRRDFLVRVFVRSEERFQGFALTPHAGVSMAERELARVMDAPGAIARPRPAGAPHGGVP